MQFAHLQKLIVENAKDPSRSKVVASQVFRPDALILAGDHDPVDILLRRTQALLAHLRALPDAPNLSIHAEALEQLQVEAGATVIANVQARARIFERLAALRRKISLSNPLLDFERILFIKRPCLPGKEEFGNHMCQQYYGFYVAKAGGLFVLDNALSANPSARDLLADSICQSGRLKGAKLPPGGYLAPELSYDGKTILFAFTEAEPALHQWNEKTTYHIFRVNTDGSQLRQVTDGPVNDFDPCFLPDGRVAFISERRGGHGRCHPSPKPNYTLHSMNADGSDIVCLSVHESNEWQPSVDNNGMLVYTRWDYVDRGAFQAHNPWITTPDGRDARALAGNYGKAWQNRPLMTMDLRAIPSSPRYITTAAAHHGQSYGSLVLVDPEIVDDDNMSPYLRLTPEALFPEAEPGNHTMFGTAWPLSEDFYLCVFDANGRMERGPQNNFGIYLVDAFGNRELLYRDPALSCLSPIPLKARPCPPILPHLTAVGKPAGTAVSSSSSGGVVPASLPAGAEAGTTIPVSGDKNVPGTVGIVNVYDSRNPWPAGTKIKALRIMQVLPKTTWRESSPRIGHGFQKGARAVLGTVPVEEDGSVYFRLPADKPVFFQALDERGLAVQSMRSDTYVHPGQQLVCQGCHESKHQAPSAPRESPLAFRRAASEIQPDVDGSRPFSYPRLVQPILDQHCVACHEKDPKAVKLGQGDFMKNKDRWYASYNNLKPFCFYVDFLLWNDPRTTPGKFGARASKLLAILDKGHYDVKLSPEELHRITLWLDCNSDFFGSYENIDAQARGEVVQPTLE
jgi:hypothetical protein